MMKCHYRLGVGLFMFEIKYAGQSQEPVVVIDDFHPNFAGLRQQTKTATFAKHNQFYPGVQAPADPSHLQPVSGVLTEIFKTVFGVKGGVRLLQCAYSVVTTPDGKLAPIQRLPHVDTYDIGRIALLHYFSGAEQGGTAFYRHKATGLELLTDKTYSDYEASVKTEGTPKPGYMRGSDDRFDMTLKIDAAPNRAILYRSALLHSGFIPSSSNLPTDPFHGRLTLNTFFQAKD